MRRAAPLALALAVLAAAPAAAQPAPARLLVEAREFNLALSRPSVRAGEAIVQLANRGEDPHDLRIVRIGGRRAGSIGEIPPGEVGEWSGRLRRGRYRLYCTLEGHRAAGMKATLRVRG